MLPLFPHFHLFHQPEFVLEDAVLSFRKLKRGGYLVFDDYGWGSADLTQRGIDAFLAAYRDRIELVGGATVAQALVQTQLIVRRLT